MERLPTRGAVPPYSLCRCRRDILRPPFEQVSSLNQGAYLSVRDRSAEHPEPAIRVHVPYPAGPHGFLRLLDRTRHLVRLLDLGPLDVDDAESHANLRSQVP